MEKRRLKKNSSLQKKMEKMIMGNTKNFLLLLSFFFLSSCQREISYRPPGPIKTLHKKQQLSPALTARFFFEEALQKKKYWAFLDYGSWNFIFYGPDKEHFLEALKHYPLAQGKLLASEEKKEGGKAEVKLFLKIQERKAQLKVKLVWETGRWRVENLEPPLPYLSFEKM